MTYEIKPTVNLFLDLNPEGSTAGINFIFFLDSKKSGAQSRFFSSFRL
ncbi:hypothetical protein HOLDEFILI_01063 [Holdemania filiformis DSM 12042]|uniref:Uncharacterized protein n=1 Tax=Holdemania filiformis DSM 12042 TaxID=545696 RepID=B9Y5I1_9FIRM|nr:hypothetical protein HOLDEFILI_01063 [Holdemania filiformis DSM 12042]